MGHLDTTISLIWPFPATDLKTNLLIRLLERFDFRPNIYAVNQNRRLTKNIGIVVPYLADPFFAEIARNI